MNKILMITIAGILTLLFSVLAILLSQSLNAEPAINHTLTKAICSGNSCQDYNISCKNQNVITMVPTGDVVKFSPDWKDPRPLDKINNLC